MTCESLDELVLFVVVDFGDFDAVGERTGAIAAYDGSDGMLACFEEVPGDDAANLTAGLLDVLDGDTGT